MPKIKGLIFDLDGTLTLTQQFHAQAFGEVFKKYGINYTTDDDLRHSGEGSRQIFPRIFAEHGINITEKQIEQYSEEKKVIYSQIIANAQIETVPGIKKFLERMKKQGLKMIVASGNKLEAAETILKRTKIREYFQEIVTNKDVEKSKPAPDIFLKAAEKLNLKPAKCCVFEDSINGIIAAKTGKIPCIAITTGTESAKLKKAGAKFTVKDYNEITDQMLN